MAGHLYPGHTEMLADLTKAKESGMMIMGGPLKDCLYDDPSTFTGCRKCIDGSEDCEGHSIGALWVEAVIRGKKTSDCGCRIQSSCWRERSIWR